MHPDLFDGQSTAIEHQRRVGRASGLPDQIEHGRPLQNAVLEVNCQVELDVMDANLIRIAERVRVERDASSTGVVPSPSRERTGGSATLRPRIANDINPATTAATVVTPVLLLCDDFASRR